jgi:ADP-ribose pyrophosphatase YjhB (NUDIX family)
MERWRLDSDGKNLHYFSIPGGGIEPGESPQVAVVREIFEEMSIVVRPIKQLAVTPRQKGGSHTYFLCEYLSGEPVLSPESEEAGRASEHNRYQPCWVSKADFARIQLHADYLPMRDQILELLK